MLLSWESNFALRVSVKCVNTFDQDLVLGFRPEFCQRFGVFWSAGVSCGAFTQLLLKIRMTRNLTISNVTIC